MAHITHSGWFSSADKPDVDEQLENAWGKIYALEFDDEELSAYQLNHADDIVAGLALQMPLLHLCLLADDAQSTILDMEFRELDVSVCKRNQYMAVNMSLHTIQAHDRWSESSHFPYLARNAPQFNSVYFPHSESTTDSMTLPGGHASSRGKHLFSLSVELPPLDNSSSLKLDLDAEPMEITICMPFLTRVMEFVAIEPVNLHALELALMEQLANQ